MKAYIFHSVHEELFHRVAEQMRRHGVTSFSGFVWGKQQEAAVSNGTVTYDPLVVFTRDVLPKIEDETKPDLEWLARREQELGISIQRMLNSERHLLKGRSFEQIMKLAEVVLRELAAAYDRDRPDLVFSEDISCFVSYAHYALARERGIPYWCISNGRMPGRLAVYSAGPQQWEGFVNAFETIRARGLTASEREEAEAYVTAFRNRPARPSGMGTRALKPTLQLRDVERFRGAATRYLGDPRDPTVTPPFRIIKQRLVRMARVATASAIGVFEKPVAGEKYFFYPIHFQPEASTLVQAPMYLDQLALLQDLAASLPIGHRLYVKEHISNRGRRTMEFYRAIRAIPAVRLLGPDEDTWSLIRGAAAIAVITGTVGLEGLLFDKPVITFGDVFFNVHPSIYRASLRSKDEWHDVFSRAITSHASDSEATLALITALKQASYPGFIGNPSTFPEALLPENIDLIADALAAEAGLGAMPQRKRS